MEAVKKLFTPNMRILVATVVGLGAGYLSYPEIDIAAQVISDVFINLLKLVSLPIIFLSIVSTASSMENLTEIKVLGKMVIRYTLLTTVIAAAVALFLFVVIDPVQSIQAASAESEAVTQQGAYVNYLLNSIPSNFVKPFSEHQVISVLFLAILLSFAMLSLPEPQRKVLGNLFTSLYAALMKITSWIIQLMPLAIFAFLVLFFRDFRNGLEMKSLALYLACVVGANLIQGALVLPAFLKLNGVSPIKMIRGMMPALSVAFFTKSSSGALPMAIRCAQENVKMAPKVANFTLPLCTTINMNGCAAFILITVLYVSMSHGIAFSPFEMVLWIFIATLAAVGNAGVPMGCYFLASAFLAAMDVPMVIMGIILPFYSMIDMLESALNVWSDSCVAAVVDKKVAHQEALGHAIPDVPPVSTTTTRCC